MRDVATQTKPSLRRKATRSPATVAALSVSPATIGVHHCAALSRPQCLSQRDPSDGGAGPLAGGAAAAGHGRRTRLHRGGAGLQRAGRKKHQPGSSSQQVCDAAHITATDDLIYLPYFCIFLGGLLDPVFHVSKIKECFFSF